MRRLIVLLGAVLAACATPPPQNAPRNPPTLSAPTQFLEAQQSITLNNIANVKYLGRLDQPGTLSTVFNYAISPDATRLVGLNNEEILAWNLLDGSLIFQTARSEATRVFYSSDKTEIYSVDGSGLTVVRDANSGALKTTFQGNPHYANSAAYSADAGWLALGGTDGTVKVWDTYERQSLVTIDAHDEGITALAFSPDGERLATASPDGLVRMWDWRAAGLRTVYALELGAPTNILRLAFAPNSIQLAIGTDRDARLWNLLDSAKRNTLETGRGGASQILMYSSDGSYLLAGNQSTGLSLWNPVTNALIARLPDTQGDTIAAAFSPDGNFLLTSVLNGKVALWNLVQATTETVNQADLPVGTQQILNVEWTNDGRLLMFFDASGPVYLWGIGA